MCFCKTVIRDDVCFGDPHLTILPPDHYIMVADV